MKKLISFLFIFILLLFGLFFTTKTVWAAYIELSWNQPAPYDPGTNPTIYQRGGTIPVSGTLTASGCINTLFYVDVNFFIETISGNTKSWTKLGTVTVTVENFQGSFATQYTLPSNTYEGANFIMLNYYSALWAGVPSENETYTKQIMVGYPGTIVLPPSCSLCYSGTKTYSAGAICGTGDKSSSGCSSGSWKYQYAICQSNSTWGSYGYSQLCYGMTNPYTLCGQ